MKQNFDKNGWSDLEEEFPREVKIFFLWLDNYKQEVEWDRLFDNINSLSKRNIQFDHIPLEMQLGILKKFFYEELKIDVDLSLNIDVACVQIAKLFFELRARHAEGG